MITIPVGFFTPAAVGGGDPDAQAYITAVQNAGGTLTAGQETAVDTLFTDLKSAGLYSTLNAFWPLIGGNTASAAIEAKGNTAYDLDFYGGMTFDGTGASGNGTNAYALMGDLKSGTGTQISINSYSFGFNQVTQNTPAKSEEIIFGQSLNNRPVLQIGTNLTEGAFDNNTFIRSGSDVVATGPSGNTAAAGTYILNRNNASNTQLYKDAVQNINLNTTSSASGTERPLAIWNFYQGSGVYFNGYTNQKLDFFFWGEGLTGGQISSLDQIIKDWSTNIQ